MKNRGYLGRDHKHFGSTSRSKEGRKRKICAEYGTICPQCGAAQLLYDGILNLVCAKCGYESSAGFT